MQVILEEFWARKEVVTQQNGYHVPQFRSACRTTQVVLPYPTLFNMSVDKVVSHWMSITVEYDAVIRNGLGHALGRRMGFFYVEDGRIGFCDPEWIHGDLNIITGQSCQIVLVDNVAKSKTMTCYPVNICSVMSE